MTWHATFLVAGIVCFALAAAGVGHPRCNLGWLGATFVSGAFFLPIA